MQIDTLQNVNWGGVISVWFYTTTADWRSPIPFCRVPIYILEGANWRLRLSWGVLIEKGGKPKKLVLRVSPRFSRKPWKLRKPQDATLETQKNPRVRKILVRDSGAGSGCANFMGTWISAFFLQETLHVHKIPRFRGGRVFWVWGGKCRFYFMGVGIFLRNRPLIKITPLFGAPRLPESLRKQTAQRERKNGTCMARPLCRNVLGIFLRAKIRRLKICEKIRRLKTKNPRKVLSGFKIRP